MTTKNELVDEAQELGVDTDGLTKTELEDAIAARTPAELGPVVPEGATAPELPKASGSPTVGIQPQTADDIPESGR